MRGFGSTTASNNLRHTDGVRPPARGSASRDPILAVTMVMAISPRNAHRCCTLARPLSKRRDGHHKKALLATVGGWAQTAVAGALAGPGAWRSEINGPAVCPAARGAANRALWRPISL